ncbi:unnamed protein product [Lymnaea stagnalis]|uniref:Uncharacterized protein n=1 Tax=Lymnaea stagnalis TaxID=6523 RepID=A0AAV2IQM2_LYMST
MQRLTPHLLRSGCDFLHALVNLLEGQTMLKSLDLSNAGLTVDQGLRLLLAVCKNCGETLHSLKIFKLMTPELGLDIGTDARYLMALSQFVNVSVLRVNHTYMSDDVLFLLSAHGKLKDLAIHAEYYYYGRADSRTSEEAWQLLTLKCPDLEVTFVIKGVSHDQSLCDILTPSIPLCMLLWFPANYTTSFNTKNCFQHIASHFQKSLRDLVLFLDFSFLNDEEDIANVIAKCTCLNTLIIDSKMKVQQQIRVERAIRKAVGQQPDHRLQTVIINNEVINLEETWLTSLIGWLVVLVN